LRINWLKRALLDLDEAESYIMRNNPSAAAEVVLSIVRTVSMLGLQPGLGRPGRVSGTKELVVPDTPYNVPYRVKENTVQVLRVYHSSRKWPDEL
jgi:plasmid stabilization system protein ParE